MADFTQQYEAEDADPPALSFFPDPPPFYKHFTTENLARLKEVKDSTASDEENGTSPLSADQISALPTELRYLIPPEPPADDEEFHVFNEKAKAKGADLFDKNMEYISEMLKLEGIFTGSWKYRQLPEEPASTGAFTAMTHQQKLYSCVRSLILSYVRLLGIMASDPVSATKSSTLDDMLTLVTNMHALINEYRPHQARETLIEKMEAQVERKKKEIQSVHNVAERVRDVLEGLSRQAEGLHSGTESTAMEGDTLKGEDAKRFYLQRHMWNTLDEVLGL